MAKAKEIITAEHLESRIYEIRGLRIMLGSDLAKLYGVEAKYLVRAFKRNIDRFPDDFAFQLSNQEVTDLKCQIGTSSSWGGRRTLPFAFIVFEAIDQLIAPLTERKHRRIGFKGHLETPVPNDCQNKLK